MAGLYDNPPPVTEMPPASKRGPAGLAILILLVVLVLEIPAYFLWKRTQRDEREAASLTAQAQQLSAQLAQARGESSAAAAQAAQAAQQRDQADQARTESERAATHAQNQAVIAAAQASHAQQLATAAQQEAQRLRAERQAELDHLNHVLSQIISTRETASSLVLTLDSNAIRFDFDKAAIRPGNREVLSRMAGVLMTLQGYQIYVYGYTDDVGSEQYNQKLSERRASAVRDYLVQAGVDSGIVATHGYGKSDPLEKGASAQARAKNRRVEIGIVDSVLRMDADGPPPTSSTQN
jgi:outer membrane protein OmpA-like peptidoglycan-associated protein